MRRFCSPHKAALVLIKARMKSREQMLGHFNAQKKTPEDLFMALSCLSTFFIPRSTRAASATFVQVLDRHNYPSQTKILEG